MEIKGVEFQQYDSSGNAWPGDVTFRKKRQKISQKENKPVNAIILEKLDLDLRSADTRNQTALLSDLVKSLPEEYVRERMTQVKDSYPIIDDYLVEKLIMEVL